MEKLKVLAVTAMCLFLSGCSNEFAKTEYDSNEKIASSTDRYVRTMSILNTLDGGCKFTCEKFDGRNTLWTEFADEAENVDVEITFSLAEGTAKIVHIDSDGNVNTLIECTPETLPDGSVTENVSLSSGKNTFKIVGYDCRDIDLELLVDAD